MGVRRAPNDHPWSDPSLTESNNTVQLGQHPFSPNHLYSCMVLRSAFKDLPNPKHSMIDLSGPSQPKALHAQPFRTFPTQSTPRSAFQDLPNPTIPQLCE